VGLMPAQEPTAASYFFLKVKTRVGGRAKVRCVARIVSLVYGHSECSYVTESLHSADESCAAVSCRDQVGAVVLHGYQV